MNECKSPLMNDCDRSAQCIDKPLGFTCKCHRGFEDVSENGASRPGRKCVKSKGYCNMALFSASYFKRQLKFILRQNIFKKIFFVNLVSDHCLHNDCDPKARCTNSVGGYRCDCPANYADVSLDVVSKPGRTCALRKWIIVYIFAVFTLSEKKNKK